MCNIGPINPGSVCINRDGNFQRTNLDIWKVVPLSLWLGFPPFGDFEAGVQKLQYSRYYLRAARGPSVQSSAVDEVRRLKL